MLRKLYQTRKCTPQHIRSRLLKSYLSHVLLNGCTVKNALMLNTITRYVHGFKRFEGCSSLSKSLYCVELGDFRKIKQLILLHKIIYTKTSNCLYSKLRFGRTSRRILPIPARHHLLISEFLEN